MTTRDALLREAVAVLGQAGVPDPARDVRLLLRWASGLDAANLSTSLRESPSPDEANSFRKAVSRRARREPLSHITGSRAFHRHEFEVTGDVLDPRPETEVLVNEALHRGPFERVLDLGTGSGCILLSLLAAWPTAMGLGTDQSAKALRIAARNADKLGLAARCEFLRANWLDEFDTRFDLIVSNPPYIAEAEMEALSPEVRLHEPREALTPGGDGLDAYNAIGSRVREVLLPGGWIMLEIGPTQAEAVANILASNGLSVRSIIPDLDQRPRVVTATM